MHFIVLGAGAVGTYIGGRLAAQGQHVSLVGRAAVLEPIARQGLRVTDLEGYDQHVPAAALQLASHLADASPAPGSVVLLCVKSAATEAAARELAACCAPGTTVVSLQNGVGHAECVATLAPALQVLSGMVPYNVVLRPAHVHRATAGALVWQRDKVTEAVVAQCQAAGLISTLSGDIRAVQWGKLLLNLNNPVNALSGLPLREQLQDRDLRCVLAALQREALAVLGHADIVPAKIGAVSPSWMPHFLRLPNVVFAIAARRMLRIDAQARSSMWDDLEAGRITEIDALCGAVVRVAQQHGMQAPLNAQMIHLLQGPRQRLSGVQLRRALGL